jgi:hypothetical protein
VIQLKQCKYYKTAQRYLDGELSIDKMKRFETHLWICGECRKYIGEVLALKHVFERKQPVMPPHGLEQRILDNINDFDGVDRKFWRRMGLSSRKLIPVAAVFCFLMVALIYTAHRSDRVTETNIKVASYYTYTFNNNEKIFISGDENSAASTLYTVLASSNNISLKY